MASTSDFRALIQRVRAGDEGAATELFRRYEPALRIEIRRRLHDPYLQSSFDSEDVCQSVLMSFFLRAAAGEYELNDEKDLVKLLARMARNKVVTKVRHFQAKARDPRRVEGGTETIEYLPNGPDPSRLASGKEILERFRLLLTHEERLLADLRVAGHTWPDIAKQCGGQAQALRHKLDRALARVLQELGLEAEGEIEVQPLPPPE